MNVAVVVLDTLRKDKLSIYNSEINFTENLEAFSQEATVYTDAVAQGPWTLPSISSILTGEYPWNHGATQETLYLEDEYKQLPEVFSEKGYSTGAYTDNPWISSSSGLDRGFDELENYLPGVVRKAEESEYVDLNKIMERGGWFIDFWFEHFGRGYKSLKKIQEKLFGGREGERTRKVFDDSIKFAEESENDFFLFMNLMTVHYPKEPPEKYREKHMDEPDRKLEEELSHETANGIEDVNVERVDAAYDACTDYLDDEFGRFIDSLEEKGLLDDTVVVVLGDHGENLGEDNRVGHSFSVSEALIRVPLMIRVPGNEPGREQKQVELRELYNALPMLAEGEKIDLETEYAKGAYGYPDLDLKAAETMERARDSRLTYVKNGGRKVVREDKRIGGKQLFTGKHTEREVQDLIDRLPDEDSTGDERTRKKIEDIQGKMNPN